jgi:hypothetical protein
MLDNQHRHHHHHHDKHDKGGSHDDMSPRKVAVPVLVKDGKSCGGDSSPLGGATPGSTPESITAHHSGLHAGAMR